MKGLAVLVLRYKQPGQREFRVPLNLKFGKVEIPLGLGIITLILGLLVWRQWPSSSLWVIGTLVGISMIMTGTTRLMISLAARRVEHSIA